MLANILGVVTADLRQGNSAERFAAVQKADIAKYAKRMKAATVKVE